jgi:hypothetical protein
VPGASPIGMIKQSIGCIGLSPLSLWMTSEIVPRVSVGSSDQR